MPLSPFKKEDELTENGLKLGAWAHKWIESLQALVNTNETNITTNTADIATNTADIATNAADIATLQTQSPTLGTPQDMSSGTATDFTSIPSWVTKIIVTFKDISTDGTNHYLIQIGDSGGIETTGYTSASSAIGTGSTASAAFTTGFGIYSAAAASTYQGKAILTLENATNNTWECIIVLSRSDVAGTRTTGGSKSLSGTLDRIRVTTTTGLDNFDGSGEGNIWYE